jgi:hypothetical protein
MGPTHLSFSFPLFFLSTDFSHQLPIHLRVAPPSVRLLPTSAALSPTSGVAPSSGAAAPHRRRPLPHLWHRPLPHLLPAYIAYSAMAPPAWTPVGARGGGRGLAPPCYGAGRLLAARGPCSRQICPWQDPALVAGAPRPPSPSTEISELPRRRWWLSSSTVEASVVGMSSSPPLLFSLCEAGIQLHKRDGGTVMADGCDGIPQRPRRVVWMARERVGPPPRLCVQAEREDA